MYSDLVELYSYRIMKQETYDILIKKYQHEIKIQREMIGSIREETCKPDSQFSPEKLEYLQHVYNEYTGRVWMLFHFDAEQIEIRNKK